MTRAQMASMFARAFKLTLGDDIDRFTDDNGSVHEKDINCLAEAGIALRLRREAVLPEGLMLEGATRCLRSHRAMN